MKYLFTNKRRLIKTLKGARNWALILDFDGTLSKIAPHPELAKIDPKVERSLREILKKRNVFVVILSGRPVKDIKEKIDSKKVIYAGHHGLELQNQSKELKYSLSSFKRVKSRIGKELLSLSKESGVFIEKKPFSLAFHYRMVKPSRRKALLEKLNSLTKPYVLNGETRLQKGKMVCEFLPPIKWDKGEAIKQILKGKKGVLPIYVGDDLTDEHAFRLVSKRGFGIRVGKKKISAAQYYLKSQGEVSKLLNLIRESLKN